MASLETVPSEIYLLVIENLTSLYPPRAISAVNKSLADINALAATSRSLYPVFNPILYQEAARCEPGLLFWACRYGFAGIVEKLLKLGVSPNRALVMHRINTIGLDSTITMDWDPEDSTTALEAFRTRFRGIPWYHPKSTFWNEGRASPKQFIFQGNGAMGPSHQTWLTTARLSSETEVRGFCEQALVNYPRPFCFPIHLAVLGGHSAIIDALVAAGSYIDSPSHFLCGAGFCDGLNPPQLCLTSGPKPNLWTPLHIAICHSKHDSRSKVVELLLAHHVQVPVDTTYNHLGISPLHWAAATGDMDLIDRFLRSGHDIHATDPFDLSPLWYAYLNARFDAVRLLVAKGADIDDDCTWGLTPLVHACLFGEPETAQELIDIGADIHVQCFEVPSNNTEWSNPFRKGLRALDFAVLPRWVAYPGLYADKRGEDLGESRDSNPQCNRRLALVRKLLSAGASTSASPGNVLGSTSQFTPLILASFYHQINVMKSLLTHMGQQQDGSISAVTTSGHNASHAVIGGLPGSSKLPVVLYLRKDDVPENHELLVNDCISLLDDFGLKGAGPVTALLTPVRVTHRPVIQGGSVPNTPTAPGARRLRRRRPSQRTASPETPSATQALMRAFTDRDIKACQSLFTKHWRIQNGERLGGQTDVFRDLFRQLAREFHADSQSDLDAFKLLCNADRDNRIGEDPDLFLDALIGRSDSFWAMILNKDKDRVRQMVEFPLKFSSFLHTALIHRGLTVSRLTSLLEQGIDPDVSDSNGIIPPVTLAVKRMLVGHVKTFANFSAHMHIVDRQDVEEGWDCLSNLFKFARTHRVRDFPWGFPAPYCRESDNPILTAIRIPFDSGQLRYELLEDMLKSQPLTHNVPARLHFEYLREACRLLDVQTLTFLLEHGANCNAPARKGAGHTALWWLLHHRDDILKFPFGKPIPSKPYTHNTGSRNTGRRFPWPPDWTAMSRPFAQVEFDPQCMNWLEARMAILDCWVECVEVLLKAGADTKLTTESGKTIADYFEDVLFYKGNKRLLVRLREAVKDRALHWRDKGYMQT